MKLILIGPPGTGKDTQARFLKEKYKLSIISAGDIIREEIKKKSKDGLIFRTFYEKGELYTGDILDNLINEKIKNKKNFMLNGYPRTLIQAKKLKNSIDHVIYIYSSRENIIKRLIGRGRIDDIKEVIEHRIEIYNQETKPVLNFYKKKVIKINGNLSPKLVFEEIIKKIDRNIKNRT